MEVYTIAPNPQTSTPQVGWYADPVRAARRWFDGENWSQGRPGWYADPTCSTRQRWFDGEHWTAQVSGQKVASSSRLTLARHLTTIIAVAALLIAGYFSWVLIFSNYWGEYQQSHLRSQLAAIAATTPKSATPTIPSIPPTGTAVGTIIIPKIGVNAVFSSGTSDAELERGPGLWQAGAFPGTPGNATISGHRTTYGAWFFRLNQLVPGDLIYIEVPGQPTAVFQVRASQPVVPSDVAVTASTPGVRLTLTTCNPPYSSTQRLVVQAEEIKGAWASHALPSSQWVFQ